MADDRLCLLTVHAHPDDESSKGASTVARYVAEGAKAILVCCTGGEEGEVLNPSLDVNEIGDDLPSIRLSELKAATEVIGFDEVEMLGYRDSGMPGAAANDNPECFAQAPPEEATEKLVSIIRRHKPDVIITYGDDEGEYYPHPDHLKVHEIAVAAFAAASDPSAFSESGDPWQPSKLYYSTFSFARFQTMSEWFERHGIELPGVTHN